MVMHMCKIRKQRFVKKLFNTWRMGCIIHVQEQSISKFGKLYWLLGVLFQLYNIWWVLKGSLRDGIILILWKLKGREQNTWNERGYSHLHVFHATHTHIQTIYICTCVQPKYISNHNITDHIFFLYNLAILKSLLSRVLKMFMSLISTTIFE